MTDDDNTLPLAIARHEFEKSGLPWDGKVTRAELMAVALDLTRAEQAAEQAHAAMTKQLDGLQRKADHTDRHALAWRGVWQPAEQYAPGNVVHFDGGLFTALRDVAPGKAEPTRAGSGWDRML